MLLCTQLISLVQLMLTTTRAMHRHDQSVKRLNHPIVLFAASSADHTVDVNQWAAFHFVEEIGTYQSFRQRGLPW